MITVERAVAVKAPFDEVWAVVRDPDVVASCIPGLTLRERTDDGRYRGRFVVSFGPTRVSFDGEADIQIDETDRGGTIKVKGIDQGGRTRAHGSSRFNLVADPAGSLLNAFVEFDVAGPLAGFARTGGAKIFNRLIEEMAVNIQNLVAPEPEVEPPAEPQRSTSWLRRVLDSLRRLFRAEPNLIRNGGQQ